MSRKAEERYIGGKRLKSGPSVTMVMVTFVNSTERSVDVAWLDYKGQQFKVKTLQPLQRVDVNTFVGHPWIFRDSSTGDKLVIETRDVFFPPMPDSDEMQLRKLAIITIPGP